MGSKFIEKHKRKSLLAALLFIFQGRAKYVTILLVVTLLSTPFVISGNTLSRMVELRPVAAVMKALGMGGILDSINPRYSAAEVNAVMVRAAADSRSETAWQKFLDRMSGGSSASGQPSSLSLITGGGPGLFGLPKVDESKDGRRGPDQVKGVVNEDERKAGAVPDGVDLSGLLAGGPGALAQGEQGAAGDSMAQNLYGNFSGGSPYVGNSTFNGSGPYAENPAAAMYSGVIKRSSAQVPAPSSPSRVRTRIMGRVSGFSWRNVGYNRNKSSAFNKLGNKHPMFQLAETYAMARTVDNSPNAAYEYQAAYTGATFDGNKTDADMLQTDAQAPNVPDTSFTDATMSGIAGQQQAAQDCSDSQSTNGTQMSKDGKEMDDITNGMGRAPRCYDHGAVGQWNSKVAQQKALCDDYNANEAVLSGKCQTQNEPMSCSKYTNYTDNGGMLIKTCPKPNKWLTWVIGFALMIIGIVAAFFGAFFIAAIAIALAIYMLSMNSGADIGSIQGLDQKDKSLSNGESQGSFNAADGTNVTNSGGDKSKDGGAK